MATWNRCSILHSPPQTDVPLFCYLITLNSWNVVIQNYTVSPFSWPFQPSTNSVVPQNIDNGWITILLCCICIRLMITNHFGSSYINQLSICPARYVYKFEIFLHCSRHALRETSNSSRMYSLNVPPLHITIFCIYIYLYPASDSALSPPDIKELVSTLPTGIPFKEG